MNFLICGLGSIGQRHARLLRRVLGDEANLYAYRSRGLDIVIRDDMTATPGARPEEAWGITASTSLEACLDRPLDAVFVTNPISLHLDIAIAAAERGHNLFIEKPLAASMAQVARLESLVREKRLVGFVGYQLRFHPALEAIRTLLREGAIGDVIAADIHFGEWLPGMHPYEDYRISHAARADQGGGVILCLSHEIDYACWLFGRPETVYAAGGHLSDLELDVEDTAVLLMRHRWGGRHIPVGVHLDFIQKPPRRYCRVTGSGGFIHWDYHQNVVAIHDRRGGETRELRFEGWQRNDMFVREITHFVACLRGEAEPLIPISAGAETLAVCLAARESLETGRVVSLP